MPAGGGAEPLRGPAAELFNPKRFAIASLLYLRGPLTMGELQRATGLSWGDLDYNVRLLSRRGLVGSRRVLTGRGPRVVVFLTRDGVRAYEELVSYLRRSLGWLESDPEG
ncbi:MAG: MarR family winged helix-turn-helix transcriptional regulator [Desulfurococcales archaeon]|nr:MarR family winged helix-turn-helix transcriptional regulator [Desulfurococcales archaeon]